MNCFLLHAWEIVHDSQAAGLAGCLVALKRAHLARKQGGGGARTC